MARASTASSARRSAVTAASISSPASAGTSACARATISATSRSNSSAGTGISTLPCLGETGVSSKHGRGYCAASRGMRLRGHNEGPAPAGPSLYSPALLLGQVFALHATEYLGQGEQAHPGQPVRHRQQPGPVSILPGRHQCRLYLVQDLALPLGAGLSDVAVTANQPTQQPLFRDDIRPVRVMDDLRPLWVMVVDAHCWASYRRSSGAAGCKAGCSLRIRFRIAC